jgi:PilZ domain
MEKRWSERKPLQVDVDVYQQGELLGSCYSSDIGLGGAFLAVGDEFSIPDDIGVELVFSLEAGERNTRHKINARVTRKAQGGIGLKFCDFDTGVFRSLQEIMSYKKNTPTEHIVGHSHTH